MVFFLLQSRLYTKTSTHRDNTAAKLLLRNIANGYLADRVFIRADQHKHAATTIEALEQASVNDIVMLGADLWKPIIGYYGRAIYTTPDIVMILTAGFWVSYLRKPHTFAVYGEDIEVNYFDALAARKANDKIAIPNFTRLLNANTQLVCVAYNVPADRLMGTLLWLGISTYCTQELLQLFRSTPPLSPP